MNANCQKGEYGIWLDTVGTKILADSIHRCNKNNTGDLIQWPFCQCQQAILASTGADVLKCTILYLLSKTQKNWNSENSLLISTHEIQSVDDQDTAMYRALKLDLHVSQQRSRFGTECHTRQHLAVFMSCTRIGSKFMVSPVSLLQLYGEIVEIICYFSPLIANLKPVRRDRIRVQIRTSPSCNHTTIVEGTVYSFWSPLIYFLQWRYHSLTCCCKDHHFIQDTMH